MTASQEAADAETSRLAALAAVKREFGEPAPSVDVTMLLERLAGTIAVEKEAASKLSDEVRDATPWSLRRKLA